MADPRGIEGKGDGGEASRALLVGSRRGAWPHSAPATPPFVASVTFLAVVVHLIIALLAGVGCPSSAPSVSDGLRRVVSERQSVVQQQRVCTSVLGVSLKNGLQEVTSPTHSRQRSSFVTHNQRTSGRCAECADSCDSICTNFPCCPCTAVSSNFFGSTDHEGRSLSLRTTWTADRSERNLLLEFAHQDRRTWSCLDGRVIWPCPVPVDEERCWPGLSGPSCWQRSPEVTRGHPRSPRPRSPSSAEEWPLPVVLASSVC